MKKLLLLITATLGLSLAAYAQEKTEKADAIPKESECDECGPTPEKLDAKKCNKSKACKFDFEAAFTKHDVDKDGKLSLVEFKALAAECKKQGCNISAGCKKGKCECKEGKCKCKDGECKCKNGKCKCKNGKCECKEDKSKKAGCTKCEGDCKCEKKDGRIKCELKDKMEKKAPALRLITPR